MMVFCGCFILTYEQCYLSLPFLETLTSWWFHIKKVRCTIITFFLTKVWHLSSCLWQKFIASWSCLLASSINYTIVPLSLANVELKTLVKPRIGIHQIVLCGIGFYISLFEIIKLFFHHFQVRSIDCINILFPFFVAFLMLLWTKE